MSNSVENRLMNISLNHDHNSFFLKFKDNGQGIAQNTLNKIFNHGYTTKPDGHGFGLHNSANLTSEMKGKIWAESEGLGKGATIVIKLPKR